MNLNVEYLGMKLENPFVLASGPPTANADMIKRAFEAGWAGAVTKTLIREPVKNLRNRFATNKVNAKIIAFENIELLSEMAPEAWYHDIRSLKSSFPDRLIIASVMGDAKDKTHWIELALGCQDAGADLLELNFSCPHGYPEKGKGSAIGQSAEFAARITQWLHEDKRIIRPIIPKLTAAVSDISYIAEAVAEAGADGVSAINTYPSIMGFDLQTLKPKPCVSGHTTPGGYSGPGLKPIALRCVCELVKHPGLTVMACGGILSGFDAVEFMLMGAPIVQVCTAVMLEGYDIIARMKEELMTFMRWHGFKKTKDFIGRGNELVRPFSHLKCDDSITAVVDIAKCVGCKTCVTSCRDAGYSAIDFADGHAMPKADRCAGCSLCVQVCPTGAITLASLKKNQAI